MDFNRSEFINKALGGTRSTDIPVSDPAPSVDMGGIMKSLTDSNTLINPKSRYYTMKISETPTRVRHFSETAELDKKLNMNFYQNNFGKAYVNYMNSLSREPFNSAKMAYSRKIFGHNIDKFVGNRVIDNYNEEVDFDKRIFYKNDAERAQNEKNTKEKDIFHTFLNYMRHYEIIIIIAAVVIAIISKNYLLGNPNV